MLKILEKANYFGGSGNVGLREGEACRPLIELGYQVVLCLHMHRNARTQSSRAAKVHQRWFLAVIDWKHDEKAVKKGKKSKKGPLLTMPNAYLPQWSGRRVRVRDPVFAGGIWARASDHVVKMVNDGKAVVCV